MRNNTSHLTRLLFLSIVLALTCAPTFYVAITVHSGNSNQLALILGIVQFFIGIAATLLFAVMLSGRMFGDHYLASQTFTASYPSLPTWHRLASILLWILVFGCKFTESYFFLTLSFRDSIAVMVHMKVQGCSDRFFGAGLCRNQVAFTLTIMYVMDLVLFFLDTFLWYIIWNTVFSIGRSFALGLSIWTPWEDIYRRLPKRIYKKVLAAGEMETRYKPKVLVSQIWNAIIISMYREHLLSMQHVQNLLYHQVDTGIGGNIAGVGANGGGSKRSLRTPPFFISQSQKPLITMDDGTQRREFFPAQSEAERRISYFAQSLTTGVPEPLPVDAMPTFTVLTPHYSEKFYNFVKDTMMLMKEADTLPFHFLGFKSAAPEFTLRTRIWASLRAQTLYRTVSGMMNYSKAIKLLYRVENPEVVQHFGGNTDSLERELERMARRKFKFVVSMQRYSKFNKEEHENAEFLLRAYPDLQIAYLDEEPPAKEGGDPRIFSALIDGHSEFVGEKRRPKFRIELPGNPILGDGKSDNQNHAIVFYRGEYLQLIDVNQDNYLEECLKIRNVLAEFEEYRVSGESPYASWGSKDFKKSPVAIVGAREYIFSENIGILRDLAAGKEQTFGTLSARSMAWIGGKLHYGHPDFLNGLFMNTRGGVSKAQKGLHLNEDIYAGMNAFGRGGRIKHTEFLTFYYGHPGFHINNMLVILSVQVFIVTSTSPFVHLRSLTPGCYNLVPVFDWIRHRIISILLVFLIAFLPLFLQELVERGTWKAVFRLFKQFLSWSPVFEIFSTQIQTHSILSNLTFGGARYIATGRGFATSRIPFSILFSRFAGPGIYLGVRTLLMLLYVTLTLWTPYLIYFWISIVSLCVAPFIFNPHQFVFTDFMVDYREFLRWLCRGNSRSHTSSWINYCRLSRTMITGFKKKKLGHPSEKVSGTEVPRASWRAVIFSEVLFPIFMAILFIIAYMFVKSFPVNGKQPPSGLIRILVVSLGPIAWNAAVLFVSGWFSFIVGSVLDPMFPKFGAVMAFIAHSLGLIGMIAFAEFLWFLELWDVSHAVLGLIAMIAIQRAIHKTLISIFLTREFKHDETNRAWWTGRWYGRGFGAQAFSQAVREYVVKIIELSLWSSDLLLGHLLLFMLSPPLLIPGFDRLHAVMLFWLRPSKQIRAPLYSMKQSSQRRAIIIKYGIVYVLALTFFILMIALREYTALLTH
ncbi:1,3-beta-glucan synthase component FKS1 [Mycena floridula]|nr:1,3-beta-glucan synthase component FKS1 [Mycena floridula]